MALSTGMSRIATVVRWIGIVFGGIFILIVAYMQITEPQHTTIWHWATAVIIAAISYGIAAAVAWVIEGFAKKSDG